MTTHRDADTQQFQATIDALTHSSISTKLAVIDDLNDELVVEQTALEAQRNRLHQHKTLVAELTTDLKGIQSGEEYTVGGSGGGGGSSLPPGKVVYVDASYSGGSDSGSRETPFASLSAAIIAKCGVADSTDRIFDIASGEYTVSQTIEKNSGVKQNVTFRGRGFGSTIIQAGSSFALGKASDCLKLKHFGALRFEKLQFQNCKYGVRAISCSEIDVIHCKFIHCGASSAAANFDGSLSMSNQLSQYAAEFTDGGALRIESAGKVRVLSCQVYECNRGLRVQDCLAGGLIQGNLIQFTGQAGIYLAASSYSGATGCRDIMVTSNQVINAGNNSLLCIGGFKNSFTQNICRDGWNTGCFLWHCCDTSVSGNHFTNTNFSTFNAQGILGDAHGAGVVADGVTDIQQTALYQAKITGNVITFPGLGRAAAIYAIRIMNDAFQYGDKIYCQDNYSQGAAVHVQNDGSATILDMETRLTAVFSAAEKTVILADVATLQTAHPITPRVVDGLDDDDEITILATDRLVFIKHTEVSGLICTLPSTGMANGMTVYIKNLQIGSNPQRGWGSSLHAVKVIPATNQTPIHTIDFRFTELTLEPSNSVGVAMDNENESCRLVWLSASNTWCQTSDSY